MRAEEVNYELRITRLQGTSDVAAAEMVQSVFFAIGLKPKSKARKRA